MDYPETLATLGTRNTGDNQEWTTQRHWQHWAHATQDKQNKQPPVWRVPNVASVSGLSILGYPLCCVCPILPVSLGCPFLVTPCVACAQCCQCLWVVHSWLPPVWRVTNGASFSGVSILGWMNYTSILIHIVNTNRNESRQHFWKI
jgi:hypothetical protein